MSDAVELRSRIVRLEQKIEALTESLATEREAMEPLKKLYEQFEQAGGVKGVGILPAEDGMMLPPDAEGLSGGVAYARHLAKTLGLDGARKKALTDEVGKFMERVRDVEKEHAQVSVEGDVTTITIPRYSDGGDGLRRTWDDWVTKNLTTEEHAAYQKDRATNRLFGNRLGSLPRTIRITEKGGVIDVSETAHDKEGEEFQMRMQGPSLARDLVLENYLHLLK